MDVNQATLRSFVTNVSKAFVSEIMAVIAVKVEF